jgi:ribosome biogenesis GTPase
MPLTLTDLGWNEHFESALLSLNQPTWKPGRLSRETKINFTAIMDGGDELDVVVSGKLWHDAQSDAELPAVGDWVAIDLGAAGDEPVIRKILPRQTKFSRKTPGKSSAEQVIGTNIDYIIVVTEPGADYNPRRMERYMALIHKSGAHPIIVLNKIDSFPKELVDEVSQELRQLAPDATLITCSALSGQGFDQLTPYIQPGKTLTLVGSSGVGKSTLVNALLGEEWQWTGEVNEVTGKGRHTTVARELVVLPQGGILIDNPGMREIQMWTDEQTLRDSFADLTELAHHCKFADCQHKNDAGCAIRHAVETGALSEDRYAHFLQLDEEIAKLLRRQQKRRMNMERAQKRSRKVQARNYEDRLDLERRADPNRRSGH